MPFHVKQTIHMKWQVLFSLENSKKYIKKISVIAVISTFKLKGVRIETNIDFSLYMTYISANCLEPVYVLFVLNSNGKHSYFLQSL